MHFAFLGNHGPTFSTESHVARSLELRGHTVTRLQEGTVRAVEIGDAAADGSLSPDVFLWTQTYGLAVTGGTLEDRRDMLTELAARGIPTVSYHLDRWWGLGREDQILLPEAFFATDVVCTADGGHDQQWAYAGVNHRWFPPGVAGFECEPGRFSSHFRSDVAFVGSWRGGYHAEWPHRQELVGWLGRTYRGRARFWPQVPNRPVRGADLRDLYASTRVCVGDSCLVPDPTTGCPATRYWSDRIPETLGRGGFLLHPWVEGIEEYYTDGEHLRLWPLGDWAELKRLVDYYLEHDEERNQIARQGRAHVLEHHTYERRMDQLVDLLVTENLLAAEGVP